MTDTQQATAHLHEPAMLRSMGETETQLTMLLAKILQDGIDQVRHRYASHPYESLQDHPVHGPSTARQASLQTWFTQSAKQPGQ